MFPGTTAFTCGHRLQRISWSVEIKLRSSHFSPARDVFFHLGKCQEVGAWAKINRGVLAGSIGVRVLAEVIGRRRRDKPPPRLSCNVVLRLVCVAPWVSVLFLTTNLDSTGAVSYLASYYPVLSMGLLLNCAHAGLIGRDWWRS